MTHDCTHHLQRLSRRALILALAAGPLLAAAGCGGNSSGNGAGSSGGNAAPGGTPRLTIGVAFETLQTEFWVAALDALKKRAAERHITLLEAVADGDASKQFDQMRTFITRRVDGIILVPKDRKTVIPMIRAANAA
jgi:ABC-type sugar transport system substrate-binding protein